MDRGFLCQYNFPLSNKMVKHIYAQQLLKNFNISIYSENSKILEHKEKDVDYPDLKSLWTLHKFISIGNKSMKIINNYDDLIKLGFVVVRRGVKGSRLSWGFRGQKVEYFLVKAGSSRNHLGYIPQVHRIEYNVVENYLRMIGKNCQPRKIYLSRQKQSYYKEPKKFDDFARIYQDYIQKIYPFTFQEQEEKISIPEIPIMVTDDGRLVCLPLTKDVPTIGIFGKRGGGKTLCLHGISDRIYWKWGKRIFPCNDGLSFQTKSWSLPWEGKEFVRVGGEILYFVDWISRIGETSRPLPCVYLVPSTSNLGKIELENEVSFRISLPFKDIMEEPNSFFAGTKEELGASEKYLKNMIYDNHGNLRPDGLLYADLNEDPIEYILNLVNEKVWEEREKDIGNGQKMTERAQVYAIENEKVRGKIFNLLKEVIKERIFSNKAKWIAEKYDEKTDLYPWNACLWANVIPVLLTHNLRNTKYFGSYMRFILNDVFKRQSEDEIIKRNNLDLFLAIDEIQSVLEHPPAFDITMKIFREGRFNRLGVIYATQWIGDLPEPIKLNTDYVIAFQQNSDEANEIAKNFDFMKHQEKDIMLLKKFNAVISAKAGSQLTVYDTEGNKEIIDDGTPLKGLIFPSVSQHSAPKEEGI